MIKKLSLMTICFIFLSLLASCISPSQMATVFPTQLSTAIPTQTIPTKTQQIHINPIEKHCAETIPAEQFSSNENSTLLLSTNSPFMPFFSDPLNKDKKELNSESGFAPYDIRVSPNFKLAALTIATTAPPWKTIKLQIIDSSGVVQKEFRWKSEWGRVSYWLDNHRILIAKQSDLQLSIYNPTTIILLDIDTGQDVEVQSAYPDLNQVSIVNWGFINHRYSPNFSQVLYLTSSEDPGYVNYFALLDLDSNEILATLPIELGETWIPQWSPDGSQVLVAGLVEKPTQKSSEWHGKELFTIDAKGNISRLTHFTEYYSGTVTIQDYSWSPDGQNIAFWLQADRAEKPELVTLNINTGEIINHCITALPFHAAIKPIWSPSSKYLVIETQETTNGVSRTLLMDVTKNVITQIGENVSLIGWMVLSDK